VRALVVSSLLAAAAVLAGAASALTPTSTRVAPLPVQDLALTGRALAYVADRPSGLQCSRIGYWHTGTGRAFAIDARELCQDEASTGQGVWDVSVATRRILWLTYTGGNFREWFLWTATTTRTTPRRLRFVARDVDAPPPIVLGPGTDYAVPYAVDREVVFLADNGKALFRTTAPAPVRALTSHPRIRRFGAAVVALLASNELLGLDGTGTEVFRVDVPPGVSAIAYDDLSAVLYQRGRTVHSDARDVVLPAGAAMVDAARGQILWTRAGDLGVTVIATGRTRRLVDGSPARPVHGQLELSGLSWAQGRVVRWRAGPLSPGG
jgi:hypothetical protein